MSRPRSSSSSSSRPPNHAHVFGAANYNGDILVVTPHLHGLFLPAQGVEQLLRSDPQPTPVAAVALPPSAIEQLHSQVPFDECRNLHPISAPGENDAPLLGLCLKHQRGWQAAYLPAPVQGRQEKRWLRANHIRFLVTSDTPVAWAGPALRRLTPAVTQLLDSYPVDAIYHFRRNLPVPEIGLHYDLPSFPPPPPTPPFGYRLPLLPQLALEPHLDAAALRYLYHIFPGNLEQLADPTFSAKAAIQQICRHHPHGISTHLTGGPMPAAMIASFTHDHTYMNGEEQARSAWGRVALARRLPMTPDEVRHLPWWEIPWLTAALAARSTSGSAFTHPTPAACTTGG